jgi:hypothetical protein
VGSNTRVFSNSRDPFSDELSIDDERYVALASGLTSRLSIKNQYTNNGLQSKSKALIDS